MTRILVTGATGFIGRRLTTALRRAGYIVRAATRGPVPAQPGEASEWVTVPAFESGMNWGPALDGVDLVVHLAALAHQPGPDTSDRETAFQRANVEGTGALAKAVARCTQVRRLVHLSSVGAVCSRSEDPVTAHTPPQPDTPYGRSKLAGEQALRLALEGAAADWCIVRAPLVYGPGNPGNMARLLRLIRSRIPLPFGSISARRSFVFVDNLVDLLITVLDHSAASRQTLLVDDGTPVGTADLVRCTAMVARRSARLWPMPPAMLQLAGRAGDIAGRLLGRHLGFDSASVDRLLSSLPVDSSATRSLLGWEPPTAFEDALRLTVGEVGA